MYLMKNQSQQENMAYLVAWVLLFATPLLSLYVRTSSSDATFNWEEVFFVWGKFSIFLLLFLIHNFLLAPLLVHQHRRVLYVTVTLAIIAAFAVLQCTTRPRNPRMPGIERMERLPMPPEVRHRGPHTPPPFVGEHDVLTIIVLLLMFGANLGTKYYFRSRNDQRKLQDLEKQNLEHQLEYLKYQLNPHFFMNTLNNIHALVDIDPTKAQDTILELSRMMRFVLYEGDKSGVPLTKEFEFIRTYTNLMQLRYTSKVTITLDLPDEAPDKTIPPLMLISFIENAFKHGISYQSESFITIKAELTPPSSLLTPHSTLLTPHSTLLTPHSSLLTFTCSNSKAEKPNQERGGVGLANVKKRLDLLYEQNYTLEIKDEPDIYIVKLILPLK